MKKHRIGMIVRYSISQDVPSSLKVKAGSDFDNSIFRKAKVDGLEPYKLFTTGKEFHPDQSIWYEILIPVKIEAESWDDAHDKGLAWLEKAVEGEDIGGVKIIRTETGTAGVTDW